MPPVGIAIPYFHQPHFLEKTLESLRSQTFTDWHAVVMDDSIPTDTHSATEVSAYDVVQRIGDPRIRYQRNPKNLGLANNWNQGLDWGQSFPYCMLLHADDQLMPRYLETMISAGDRYPKAALYFCKTIIIDETGKKCFSFPDWYKNFLIPKQPEFELSNVLGIQQLIAGNFVFCPSVFYRSAKIVSERFRTDLKQVPDFEFILRLLLNNQTLVGVYSEPLFCYRRHGNNTTVVQTQSFLRFNEERDLLLNLAKILESRGEIAGAQSARQMTVIKLNLAFVTVKNLIRFQWTQAWRCVRYFFSLSETGNNS